MFVARCAAAQEHKVDGAIVVDPVPFTRPDGDRITGADVRKLAVDFHFSRAAEDVVNLFGLWMMMQLGEDSWRNCGFCQTLVSNRRVSVSQQFSDDRSVLGHKRLAIIPLDYFHFMIFLPR